MAISTMSLAVQWMRIGLPPDAGYRVHFEEKDGKILTSGCFPDRNEPALPTEEIAWAYARAFANKHTYGRFINIYIVDRQWRPVDGYREKMIVNRDLPS